MKRARDRRASRALACLALGLMACSGGGGSRHAGDAGGHDASADARGSDATVDTGPGMNCASDSECDDTNACTIDSCGVGGLCRNLPEDSFCAAAEHCDAVRGCTTSGCSVAADCDNGIYCDGPENCVTSAGMGFCVRTRDVSCDDGNACTVDMCNEASASTGEGCTYTLADGCDAGVPVTDSGTPAVPFDPTMHYTGTFIVAPAPNLGCGTASYSFGSIVFSTTASELRVQADWMSLRQTPIPTGADFTVTANNPGCADYTLTGHFTDSNDFEGTWTATMSSGCSFCPNQNSTLYGARSH